MVDVTPKEPSHRRAIARGRVHMTPETASAVTQGAIKKGDVLVVARAPGFRPPSGRRISSRCVIH